MPLVDLCLQVKVLELGSIARFLQKAIDPPKDEAVTTSVDTLREVGWRIPIPTQRYLAQVAWCFEWSTWTSLVG